MTFTPGQKKFLKAIINGDHIVCSQRVTQPLFDAMIIFPKPGAMFPWIQGCNGQMSSQYYLTEKGEELLSVKA